MRFFTLLCCFLAASTVMAKEFTIGVVDLQRLFKEYPGTAVAQKKFNTYADSKKQDLADAQKVLKDLQTQLSSGTLSEKAKKDKQDQFQQQYQDFQDQKDHAQTEIANREQEMTQTLLSQIKDIVAKVANSENVDLVLDSNNIVDVKTSVDLTADVLKKFSAIKTSTTDSDSTKP
jgi:outer membrane protein